MPTQSPVAVVMPSSVVTQIRVLPAIIPFAALCVTAFWSSCGIRFYAVRFIAADDHYSRLSSIGPGSEILLKDSLDVCILPVLTATYFLAAFKLRVMHWVLNLAIYILYVYQWLIVMSVDTRTRMNAHIRSPALIRKNNYNIIYTVVQKNSAKWCCYFINIPCID